MFAWDSFWKEKLKKIFSEKKQIIDIGGGLRIKKDKGNIYDERQAWLLPYLKRVDYKILDPVPDYNPDIIGDIHNLPFANNSQEAFVCISILEHVENPILACKEMYRSLKSGGYAFVTVPFLYYYHAEKDYYKDYWRFSKDALEYLFKDFSSVEIEPVRGAFGAWIKLSPMGRVNFVLKMANKLDILFKKNKSNQVSGYYIFLKK
jgi:SAM-dependent methyltransferase